MKILIIGGHLSPAFAVLEYFKNDEIFYVGRKYALEGDKALSLEYQVITQMKIPFFGIETARLQRSLTRYTFISLLKFPFGFIKALKIVREINPDVVIGFGGYVSVPVVVVASMLNIPVVLHEQTLEAGFANRMLNKFSQKICISWESSRKFFPKEKTVLTGLPLKKEILELDKSRAQNRIPVIYITGGSLGSHKLNQLVFQGLDKLLKNFYLIHQTGDAQQYNDYNLLSELKKSLPEKLSERYQVKKFLSSTEVANSMKKADLIVSRAGINSVAELIYLEKPAYLIPISFSQKNEQVKNANFMKSLDLAEIGDEKSLTTANFVLEINKMIKNLEFYKIKDKNNILTKNAVLAIVKVIRDVSKKKKIQQKHTV